MDVHSVRTEGATSNLERRGDLHPPLLAVRRVVTAALEEDLLPLGDLSASLLDPGTSATGRLVPREDGVLAGSLCAFEACRVLDSRLELSLSAHEGGDLVAGVAFGTVAGPLTSMLSAERTLLNFLCHLSGIASLTRRYVESARRANPATRVWDTRKTTPGLRALEKAAVRAGGAVNHRGNLSEAVLVKDNHLAGIGITEAVRRALERWPGRMVEVECDRPGQDLEALDAGATVVMCDNMTPAQVAHCVGIVRAHPRADAVLVEASGRITLETIAAYAGAGADVVSVGALTHSAPILDIGLDFDPKPLAASTAIG